MTRVTIVAGGTRGDAQPAIALGRSLQGAGYRVRLLAAAGFRTWIEGHGLESAPSAVDMQALMAQAPHLLASPPVIERLEVLGVKLPKAA